MGLPRYSRNKKTKKKRWGFGLQVHEAKKPEAPSTSTDQRRLLRPSFFRPDRPSTTPSRQPRRPTPGGYLALQDDDRESITELRKLLQRSLHDDSERLDQLTDLLVANGMEPVWHDETEEVPAHWELGHDDVDAQEPAPQTEDEDDEDPVVRQDEVQEDTEAPV